MLGSTVAPAADLWGAESMKLSVTPTGNKSEVRR